MFFKKKYKVYAIEGVTYIEADGKLFVHSIQLMDIQTATEVRFFEKPTQTSEPKKG